MMFLTSSVYFDPFLLLSVSDIRSIGETRYKFYAHSIKISWKDYDFHPFIVNDHWIRWTGSVNIPTKLKRKWLKLSIIATKNYY